ncbi:hypothetical protein LEL_09326 [Akanthomyces lecanii RCEF 1005]|uniref:2EXR domain-containing protein n=1 Tax=Akanthomyces lecanii RCEF 1005 TaxID=1081108 RepID=A0A168BZ73_CORDF|nr:hypothetical protein LEL_09326 [Akanthomyces lecanii RCEF 1005]
MENSVSKDPNALAVISEPPETPTFTFLRLPTELRIQVWKHYCPDLCEVPRLLDFAIGAIRPFGNLGQPCQHILRGLRLVDRTRSLRCVLAVHQQSRGFALAVFPDKLTVGYCADLAKECDIPFHKQRDLVYLYGFTGGTIPPHELDVATIVSKLASVPAPAQADPSATSRFRRRLLGRYADESFKYTYEHSSLYLHDFCSKVVNVAYEFSRSKPFPYPLQEMTRGFYSNLRNVFLHLNGEGEMAEWMLIPMKHRWCASKYSSHDETISDKSGRCLERAYWPNLTQHAEYARNNLSPSSAPELIPNLKDIACFFEPYGVQVWPMLVTDPSKFTAYVDGEDDSEDQFADEGSEEESGEESDEDDSENSGDSEMA